MEDNRIIELYFSRDEKAITETDAKYGKLCRSIAFRILNDREDASECVNETYYKAWNAIPPERPVIFSSFLAGITRNLSIDKLKFLKRKKRSGEQSDLFLDELQDCIPDTTGGITDDFVIRDVLNSFLENLPKDHRIIFMRRYWFMQPVKEIAQNFSMSESNVKVLLFRMRKELKKQLEKEGVVI